jgi:hypothetical protein
MAKKYYLDWKEVDTEWIGNPENWIDVYILIENTVGEILGGDYTLALDEMDPWESMQKKLRDKKIKEDKIEKLLEVIVSVKGEEKKFKKSLSESPKITISDIQKTLDLYSKNKIMVKAKIKGR